MNVRPKRVGLAAVPVAVIVALSLALVREAAAQSELVPPTTVPVSVPVDARVGQPAADPSSLYKGEVAAAVLPTEQPKTVTLKVLGSGALKDRITSVITVCSAAFASYQSRNPLLLSLPRQVTLRGGLLDGPRYLPRISLPSGRAWNR